MKRVNLKKAGISMVALVITIIVLIIITATVVITGVTAPKQAQLATFYSNLDTVQELVNIQMGNNMITAAQNGYGANYKWVGIVEGYEVDSNGVLQEPENAFSESVIDVINEAIEPIKSTLLEKTTMDASEKAKYYVGESGKVYYEGFEYEGNTYYNKDTSKEGINNKINGASVSEVISATEVENDPMSYYGAYVNYTNEKGKSFYGTQWRIFHAEEGNIYITTSGPVGSRHLPYNEEYDVHDYGDSGYKQVALVMAEDLKSNKDTYLNDTYAEWARDGIECSMLVRSYNKVKGSNATLEVNGNEIDGFGYRGALSNEYGGPCEYEVSRLSGLQEDLYNYGNKYGDGSLRYYWLASQSTFVMAVSCWTGYIGSDYYFASGIRPLVKLKSNTKLLKNGDHYELVEGGKPLVTTETSTTLNTITIKAVDDNGIIGYAVTDDNTVPSNFTSCAQTTALTQVVGGRTANIPYYVWVKDIDGNVSIGKQVIIKGQEPSVITATDIVNDPMSYYGAYVNYTAGGQSDWRIFYSNGDNIYITTSRPVEPRCLANNQATINELKANNLTYVNDTYAASAASTMTYEMFKKSYNTIAEEKGIVLNALVGNEVSGYNYSSNSVSRLSGLQADLYSFDYNGYYGYYWLAPTGDNRVMYVDDSYIGRNYNGCVNGIRPIVCLKSNVQLVENNGRYDMILDTRPVVTNETSTTIDTITIKAVDDNGIIGYAITENNVQPYNFTSCAPTTSLTQVVGERTQNTTYYVWVKDIDGNVSKGKKVKTLKLLTATYIEEHSTEYYGAVVNYQNELGNTYYDKYGQYIQWRIFHAEEGNIYLTTSRPVESKNWPWYNNDRQAALDYLKGNATYLNSTYAISAINGIEFSMFARSYNKVKGSYDTLALDGNENTGYTLQNATTSEYIISMNNYYVSKLNGTPQEDLYIWDCNNSLNNGYNNYWLASPISDDPNYVMAVESYQRDIYPCYYNDVNGIRPLVKLKSNALLLESGITDENGYMTYNIVLQ